MGEIALEAWVELGNIRDQVKVKGRFHSKMKIYGNVELCLQKLPITLILLKNVSISSGRVSGNF